MSESLTGQQRFYCVSSDLCVIDILRLFIFHFIYFNAPEVFQPQVLVSFFKHQLNCRLKEDLGEKIRPSKVRLPLTLLPYNHDLAAINQNRSSQLTCNYWCFHQLIVHSSIQTGRCVSGDCLIQHYSLCLVQCMSCKKKTVFVKSTKEIMKILNKHLFRRNEKRFWLYRLEKKRLKEVIIITLK